MQLTNMTETMGALRSRKALLPNYAAFTVVKEGLGVRCLLKGPLKAVHGSVVGDRCINVLELILRTNNMIMKNAYGT